jgi:hypothetical protein
MCLHLQPVQGRALRLHTLSVSLDIISKGIPTGLLPLYRGGAPAWPNKDFGSFITFASSEPIELLPSTSGAEP